MPRVWKSANKNKNTRVRAITTVPTTSNEIYFFLFGLKFSCGLNPNWQDLLSDETNKGASTQWVQGSSTGKRDNDYNDGLFYMINIRSLRNRPLCCLACTFPYCRPTPFRPFRICLIGLGTYFYSWLKNGFRLNRAIA